MLETRWLDWDTLLKMWRAVSTGRGVYLKIVPLETCVTYLCKYLTKPTLPDSLCEEISDALRGVRLFAPIGSWFAQNKLYVKPKAQCPNCHAHQWKLYDILIGSFPHNIRFEIDAAGHPVGPPLAYFETVKGRAESLVLT
jgi:hypothetical protein